jgi:hypothetical protein
MKRKILILIACIVLALTTNAQTAQNIDALFNKANTEIDSSNFYHASQTLNQIIDLTYSSDKRHVEAMYIKQHVDARYMLAQIYGNLGELQDMETQIDALSDCVKRYGEDKETATKLERVIAYRDEIMKQNASFFDDICGIWVSDFSLSPYKYPYLTIEVLRDSSGKYEVIILPYCSVYESIKSLESSARARNPRVYEDKAKLFFGEKRFRQGNPFAAHFGTAVVDIAVKTLYTGFGQIMKDNPLGGTAGKLGAQVAGALLQRGLYELSVSKTSSTTFDMLIERIFAGCVDITLNQMQLEERSDGKNKKWEKERKFMMFKLYPEHDIKFARSTTQIFGSRVLTEKEAKEYDFTKYTLKDFNTAAYEQLKEKVLDFYTSISEDPDNDPLMTEIEHNFIYSTQGLHYEQLKIANTLGYNGYFNENNLREGFGHFKYLDGEYSGEWKAGQKSGQGYYKTSTLEYDGQWEYNQKNGYGIEKSADYEYAGLFKNGKYEGEGKIAFTNGTTYKGTFSQGYYNKGILADANGTTKAGTWSNKCKTFSGKEVDANDNIIEGRQAIRDSTSKLYKIMTNLLRDTTTFVWQGKIIYSNGDIFKGKSKVKNGITTRSGVYTYANGDRYEGKQYKNDAWLREGKGKLTSNGETVSGVWKDDELIEVKKKVSNNK